SLGGERRSEEAQREDGDECDTSDHHTATAVLAPHRGDLPPAADPAQRGLPCACRASSRDGSYGVGGRISSTTSSTSSGRGCSVQYRDPGNTSTMSGSGSVVLDTNSGSCGRSLARPSTAGISL